MDYKRIHCNYILKVAGMPAFKKVNVVQGKVTYLGTKGGTPELLLHIEQTCMTRVSKETGFIEGLSLSAGPIRQPEIPDQLVPR